MAKACVVEGFYEAMPLVRSENPAESISTQSRLGTKLKIEFAPERFRYTISDHSGSRTFDAFYETLKVDSFPTLTMRRTIWRPRVLYGAIGIFLLATIVSNISKPLAGFLVIVAALLAPPVLARPSLRLSVAYLHSDRDEPVAAWERWAFDPDFEGQRP
jgi:hypothetical protein